VHVHVDAEQAKDSAGVRLSLRDGRTVERHIAHNLGTPDNPMTDSQLEDKFTALSSPVLGQLRTGELAEICWSFLGLEDIAAVLDLTVPG
jgi:2-methylcitrate dehydratase PrpD